MVEHPASTRVVDDTPARFAPPLAAERTRSPIEVASDLSQPENRLDNIQLSMASRRQIEGFNPGRAADVPDLTVTNGDAVVATSAKKLGDNVLESAKVQKNQGYFQAADRLLGGEFTHNEKKQFSDALRKNWLGEHPNAKSLNSGDPLLTDKNREAVLNNIADPALRTRIQERLNKGLPDGTETPKHGEREGRIKKEPQDDKPDRTEKKPEVKIQPTDLNNIPDGPVKSSLERKYEVGDRFSGLTSTYGGGFNGRETASKLRFDSNQMTAASKEFPFGTILSVTNPQTGKEVKVVITDNGPFAGKKVDRPDGSKTYERVVDLSTRANRELGNPDVVPLDYKVLYVPENGAWGRERRNLQREPLRQLNETVRKYSH